MNSKSKASLFLMELIMSILFFSLAAALCVRLFVKSHVLSDSSVILNHAVVECESAAEYFYGNNGYVLFEDQSQTPEKDYSISVSYDKDFNPISNGEESSVYTMNLEKTVDSANPGLLTLNITYCDNHSGETVYSISPVLYVKEAP